MFRRKRHNAAPSQPPRTDTDQGQASETASSTALREPHSPQMKADGMSKPAAPTTPLQPNAPRRGTELIPNTAPRRPEAPISPMATGGETKRLIVGRDISLTGNISACDRLIVEGSVEADLSDAIAIEVLSHGRFKGNAEVQDADIAGRFEGDIIVKGLLILRANAQISGHIRYGRLQVEQGGIIKGALEPIEQND